MPWCPRCRNEYVEGIKICADCKAELVDSLETEKNTVIDGEQEYAEMPEADEALWSETESDIPQMPPRPVLKGVYQSNTKKAEENRSSAYVLLIVGGAGLIFILLFLFDIINIALFASNKYMVCGAMGGLFLLFLVMGVVSLKSSKTFAQKAKEENDLTNEMKKWCRDNLTVAAVDKNLFEPEEPEEIKYFKRTERMKEMISRQFMNLDEGFLDAFIDEYYQTIYE